MTEERTKERYVVPGWLCLVGGAAIALGSALPWVTLDTFAGTETRTAFQFGPNRSLDPHGPVLLVCALLLIYDGLVMTRALHSVGRVRRFTPMGASLLSTVVTVGYWIQPWQGVQSGSVHRDVGGVISILGALLGVTAYLVLRRQRAHSSPGSSAPSASTT